MRKRKLISFSSLILFLFQFYDHNWVTLFINNKIVKAHFIYVCSFFQFYSFISFWLRENVKKSRESVVSKFNDHLWLVSKTSLCRKHRTLPKTNAFLISLTTCFCLLKILNIDFAFTENSVFVTYGFKCDFLAFVWKRFLRADIKTPKRVWGIIKLKVSV